MPEKQIRFREVTYYRDRSGVEHRSYPGQIVSAADVVDADEYLTAGLAEQVSAPKVKEPPA